MKWKLVFVFHRLIVVAQLIPIVSSFSSSLVKDYLRPHRASAVSTRWFRPTVQLSTTTITEAADSQPLNDDLVVQLQKAIQTISTIDQSPPPTNNTTTDSDIKDIVLQLENRYQQTSPNEERFQSLLGLYDVAHVMQTTRSDNSNAVGGKWTKKNIFTKQLLSIRRTFQHVLPFNSTGCSSSTDEAEAVAEAVNVISCDALWGLMRLTILLRGDAVPLTQEEWRSQDLSNLALRVAFDAPRIAIGRSGSRHWWTILQLGPTSSVVLDTTYVDNTIRIGKGGSSGTRFVFTKCLDRQEPEEFRTLLSIPKPIQKFKILSILGSIIVGTGLVSFKKGFRILGGFLTILASLASIMVLFSTGGIETRGARR